MIKLLSPGHTCIVQPETKFNARDFFKATPEEDKERYSSIAAVGEEFSEYFLDKVEEWVGGDRVLRYQDLWKTSLDRDIIAELGGETQVETTLAEMAILMSGKMIIKNAPYFHEYINIFYIRDVNGVLRWVEVVEIENGYNLAGGDIGTPYPLKGWADSREKKVQIFSRG